MPLQAKSLSPREHEGYKPQEDYTTIKLLCAARFLLAATMKSALVAAPFVLPQRKSSWDTLFSNLKKPGDVDKWLVHIQEFFNPGETLGLLASLVKLKNQLMTEENFLKKQTAAHASAVARNIAAIVYQELYAASPLTDARKIWDACIKYLGNKFIELCGCELCQHTTDRALACDPVSQTPLILAHDVGSQSTFATVELWADRAFGCCISVSDEDLAALVVAPETFIDFPETNKTDLALHASAALFSALALTLQDVSVHDFTVIEQQAKSLSETSPDVPVSSMWQEILEKLAVVNESDVVTFEVDKTQVTADALHQLMTTLISQVTVPVLVINRLKTFYGPNKFKNLVPVLQDIATSKPSPDVETPTVQTGPEGTELIKPETQDALKQQTSRLEASEPTLAPEVSASLLLTQEIQNALRKTQNNHPYNYKPWVSLKNKYDARTKAEAHPAESPLQDSLWNNDASACASADASSTTDLTEDVRSPSSSPGSESASLLSTPERCARAKAVSDSGSDIDSHGNAKIEDSDEEDIELERIKYLSLKDFTKALHEVETGSKTDEEDFHSTGISASVPSKPPKSTVKSAKNHPSSLRSHGESLATNTADMPKTKHAGTKSGILEKTELESAPSSKDATSLPTNPYFRKLV